MNLGRGFRRILVVLSVVYWMGAAGFAYSAYSGHLSQSHALAEGYSAGTMGTYRRAMYEEARRRDLVGPSAALRVAGAELGKAAAIYAAAAAILAALAWVVAGFKSDRSVNGNRKERVR